MKKRVYIAAVVVVELLGFVVGMLTREGTQLYASTINKPPLSPPGILFPIAWTVLYALMALGVARVILADYSPSKGVAVALFVTQLILNLAWCFIFFGARNYGLALFELILMLAAVAAMTYLFARCDRLAAAMQIPYLVWLCFALYLNVGVLVLN